ncbi:MAG TPA: hypothetical protein VIV34_02880 [Pseudolabrys sp.]|jgi:hypothetical protein
MNKLMYVAIIPIIALAVAMLARTLPPATASLANQTGSSMDVSGLHRQVDMKRLPDGEVAEEYLH